MNSKKRQNFLAGYTGVDAGERRKSDGREQQVFFAPMAESDKFFHSLSDGQEPGKLDGRERQVFFIKKIKQSYASPMVESEKFYLEFKISYKLYDIKLRRSDDEERQVF